MASDVEHFFHRSMGHLYVLIQMTHKRNVYSGLLPIFLIGLFVFLVWSYMSSLYILEIKHLCDVSLVNMFSHTIGSFFILMMIFLAIQKLLNFI